MAELSQLRQLALSGLAFRPADVTGIAGSPAPKLAPNLEGAAAIQGSAGMLDAASKALADLPQKAIEGTKAGRAAGQAQYLSDLYADTKEKAKTDPNAEMALADFDISPTGINYKPTSGALRDLELQGKKADIATKLAQAKWYESRANTAGTGDVNPLWDSANEALKVGTPQGDDFHSFIKEVEGFNPKAYNDSGQISIGYGTKALNANEELDEPTAYKRLQQELSGHEKRVDELATQYGVTLTPRQREALTSFDFNTGAVNRVFENARTVDANGKGILDPTSATAKMAEYKHADASAKDFSLEGRRAKEIAWFNRNDSPPAALGAPMGPLGGTLEPLPGGMIRENLPGRTEVYPQKSKGGIPRHIPFIGADSKAEADETKILMTKHGLTLSQIKTMTPAEKEAVMAEKTETIPSKIKTLAVQKGIWKDGMSLQEVSEAIEKKDIEEGTIPTHLIPAAQSMARLIVGHPALKHVPTIREAKEAVDAGLDNQDTGGFGDMAIVEGFQRMVNPGAVVRTQTMDQMLKSAGLGQYADLGFLMDHFVEGEKFSPEVRTRLKKLAEDIYSRSMKNVAPQMKGLSKVAKSYGIPNPEAFIDNVMVMTPLYNAEGAPEGGARATGAPPPPPAGKVNIQTSDGAFHVLPNTPEAIQAAKAQDPNLKVL